MQHHNEFEGGVRRRRISFGQVIILGNVTVLPNGHVVPSRYDEKTRLPIPAWE